MSEYLPVDDLRFLMELCFERVASQLGLLAGTGAAAPRRPGS